MSHNAALHHARLLLLSQYRSRVSPRSPRFQWPSEQSLLYAQSYLLQDLFATDTSSATASYRRLFLKELITRIERAVRVAPEAEEWETDGDLLELYAEMMVVGDGSSNEQGSLTTATATGTTTMSHAAPPSEKRLEYIFPRRLGSGGGKNNCTPDSLLASWHSVSLLESTALVGAGSTAVKTWEAALRLASHLIADGQDSCGVTAPNARVLELGSGTGLLTCVVAMLQQEKRHSEAAVMPSLVSTDLPSVVNGKLRDTLTLNGLSDAVHLQSLDWLDVHDGEGEATATLRNISPTLILGADIIFDPDMIPALVSTIASALHARPAGESHALIASTVRNASTYGMFLDAVSSSAEGLQSEEFDLRVCAVDAPDPRDPPILPFNSDHDPQRGGVVKGLRIWRGAGGSAGNASDAKDI